MVVVKHIRINEPGVGAWIMGQASGVFTEETDVSIANYRGDKLLGGFALTAYLDSSMCVHMAGTDPSWCSRDLLWMLFDYAFNQLGLYKLFALVRSTNYEALAQDLRAGFRMDTVLEDALPDGHIFVLSMKRDQCPWLKITPRHYRSNLAMEAA